MTKSEQQRDQELEEKRRQMTQGQQPGGSPARGPEINPGGDIEPQVPVPPYDREQVQYGGAESVRKAYNADEHAGEPGPTPPVSQEEREGVSATDTTGATPLGVGESTTKRAEEYGAEDQEAGRIDAGTQGPSQRPVGTSDSEFRTGVNPQGDPEALQQDTGKAASDE